MVFGKKMEMWRPRRRHSNAAKFGIFAWTLVHPSSNVFEKKKGIEKGIIRAPQNPNHPYTPAHRAKNRLTARAVCKPTFFCSLTNVWKELFSLSLNVRQQWLQIYFILVIKTTSLYVPCTSFGSKLSKWSWLIRPRRRSGCPSCPTWRSYLSTELSSSSSFSSSSFSSSSCSSSSSSSSSSVS